MSVTALCDPNSGWYPATYVQVVVQTEFGEVVLQVNPEVHVLY